MLLHLVFQRTQINMKFLVLALCVCAAHAASVRGFDSANPFAQARASVQAAPAPARSPVGLSSDVDAPILRFDSDVKPDGYSYAYETGNGIASEASGNVKNVDNYDVITAKGSYRYVAPDGTPVVVTYTADENGYQPQSDLLPVAPPIPEAILRSLEYIKTHAPLEVPSAVASASYRRV